MKVLLDECIPLPVKEFLLAKGFSVEHTKETTDRVQVKDIAELVLEAVENEI